jgi:hypothetical protein
MADDKNFKALIAEQKKTTTALNKLAGIEEQSSDKKERSAAQQAADDKMRGKRNEKHQIKIEKQGKTEDGTGTPPPAAGEEDKKDRMKSLANAIGKPLGKFGKSIGGAIKSLGNFFKDKFGGGVKTLGNLLKFGVAGLALMALSKFFKSPTWVEWQKTLIPALVIAFEFISSTIKSAGEMIVTGVKALHSLLTGGLFEGEGEDRKFIGMGAAFDLVLEAVKGLGVAFVGIGLLLAPKKLLFSAVKLAIGTVKTAIKIFKLFFSVDTYKAIVNMVTGAASKLFFGAIAAVRKALKIFRLFLSIDTYKAIIALVASGAKGAGGALLGAVGKVGKALTALRLFMTVSLLPAISAMLAGFLPMLAPLLPFVAIAAAVVLVLASIWNAFKDFKATLDETGSIFEALKVGFASLVANVLGIIPNLIIDFVAWIFKKLGWTEWAAKLKEIDVVSFIKNGLLNIFTKFGAWVGRIYEDYLKPFLAPLLKFFDPAINIIKKVFNFLMDAIQPVVDFISKIAKKIGGFIKKIAKKLNPINWFRKDKDEVENLDDVVSSSTQAEMEMDKAEEAPLITALPRATEMEEYTPSPEMQAAMAETTVISSPVSNTTNNNTTNTQNVVKNVIEPDVYFLRQASWAI